MNTREDVIDELRVLFQDGATPSRLIRLIVDRHPGEENYYPRIQAYFLEAFGVPIVSGLIPFDRYDHTDLRYAFLNEQLLPMMIQEKNEWSRHETPSVHENDTWLEPLSATDAKERVLAQRNSVPRDLARIWTQLTPEEQGFIHVTTASARGLSETVKILSRLSERLQQQINELQSSPSESAQG